MNQKEYIKSIYSKYWLTARDDIYGFSDYDKVICSYLEKLVCKSEKILDIGVGTGYPFADYFQKKGMDTSGIDIAPVLIEKCLNNYPEIKAEVGEAENLTYPDCCFKLTYCFHSTCLLSDLYKAIDEMIRVTKKNGIVAFDIENIDNKTINNAFLKRKASNKSYRVVLRYFKNIVKLILRRGPVVWSYINHEIPRDPREILNYLEKKGLSKIKLAAIKEKKIEYIDINKTDILEYPKILFICNV